MSECRFPTHSTPLPNRVVDELMPRLGDTELRLLLVIVRQTLGWKSGANGGRKARDWLSHGQLKARTHRSSQAVSQAIASLVEQNLIAVSNENGERMDTPQARRRCHARLYFELSPDILLPCGQPDESKHGR